MWMWVNELDYRLHINNKQNKKNKWEGSEWNDWRMSAYKRGNYNK